MTHRLERAEWVWRSSYRSRQNRPGLHGPSVGLHALPYLRRDLNTLTLTKYLGPRATNRACVSS